jgi:diketogulonate reductase-like aldo/keto reductase
MFNRIDPANQCPAGCPHFPGTNRLAHLEENLRASELMPTSDDMTKLDRLLSKIQISRDRYPADLQNQISR